ncbi:unnamed protein product [Didymodactylos carnosus]|uniref:Inosine/uridine-preferring nucleoside hydrolase domain-containing protein n=1 Tax=Didymodactylos carnosus TaxID=1234261 RepID=A0A815D3Y3_9BILA|nr:unnamed protein product [Didymodactylos carnosus]CAF1293384.1 unnamed protein product [Didymodactylos carnosus]CAF3751025.1 unnamed protein product [Didymodactylos carnosus]CAF4103272.1 unnamed protein product [Didymodactylos carnosus]
MCLLRPAPNDGVTTISHSYRQPVIIDTDADVDDLFAISYLMNVRITVQIPTIEIMAITTVGNAFTSPLYSAPVVLTLLSKLNCQYGVPVAHGQNAPSLPLTGYGVPMSLITAIDQYFKCLNTSINPGVEASPFNAVELIIYILKRAEHPVDILVLGTLTNIAEAITRDRTIVSKIGTLYFSSAGDLLRRRIKQHILPNIFNATNIADVDDVNPNVFLDLLAVQRVFAAGISRIVMMPSEIQHQVPYNTTQLKHFLKQYNITLTKFVYDFITSFAKCLYEPEERLYWWDPSTAQLMIQLQHGEKPSFCTEFDSNQHVKIVSSPFSGSKYFGQEVKDNKNHLTNVTICKKLDDEVFLRTFLTQIDTKHSCSYKNKYKHRYDIRLQKELLKN